MDAEEFLQLWHASFGPEAQPPEGCTNLGHHLSVQDVGTELRARETRVETLRTQLEREVRVLEWLRGLAADLERRDRDTSRPLGGGESAESTVPHPRETRERGSPSSSPPRPKSDAVYSTSVEVAVRSKEGPVPTCDNATTGTDGGRREDRLPSGEGEGGLLTRERAQGQVDKSVARAVRKRLIEQGKWWSSNLLTLEVSSHTPQISRRRSTSDTPLHLKPSRQRRGTVPTVSVHEVVRSFEKLGQERGPKVNTPEKEVSHVERHTSSESVNGVEKSSNKLEIETTQRESSQLVCNPPPVRRTKSQREEEEDKLIFKNHVVYSTHSLNRRHVTSRLAQLEEERPTSSTLKRTPSLSIEAKLAGRRRAGGWKVVEVGGQKRPLSKTPSPQHNQYNLGSGFRAEVRERTPEKTRGTAVDTVRSSGVQGKAREKRPSSGNMFKAAKEKLSRVTSSPPLRRRPSRGSRGREGAHRSSNGQVEPTSAMTPPPSSVSPGSGIQEVMVEKRVERSDSLLSEILSHRFSNGMEGSQLLESSGDHSLVASQEVPGGGAGGGDSAKVAPLTDIVPKVILRRRSERDNDPLPEAKRRSSYLEDEDCTTPKEDFSLSLSAADEAMTQGLTKAMVDASIKKPRAQRLTSDSTLQQESLEATLTPANISGSSPPNVNFRMSYMTAVHDSPHMAYTATGGLRDINQVDYMPLINETDGEMATGRLHLVSSEPNLLDLNRDLDDSMELDEATISAVMTLNDDLFGSRSGSVTSLPETLDDSQSTSTTSPFLSPAHTPAPVVNLRQLGSGAAGRRRNRRRQGNAELDDQTGSLDEMLLSERLRSPNITVSYSDSPLAHTSEEVRLDMSGSPTTPTLFSPPHHAAHLKEMEVYYMCVRA